MSMYCYQCEQTAGGEGCTKIGVCGKNETVAALQDVLVVGCKGIARYAHRLRGLGITDIEADRFVTTGLFRTVTNVNFTPEDILADCQHAKAIGQRLRQQYLDACATASQAPDELCDPNTLPETIDELTAMAAALGIQARLDQAGPDVTGLQELVLYGLKGTAAYADHAAVLGLEDDGVYAFFHEALAALGDGLDDIGALTALALKVGEVNLTVMGLLDEANTSQYGHPEPTAARITPVAGKAILVSGHDLKDLAELLEQTAGQGINVYTHGEMLPCLAYPELKKHPHLIGNYGGAWQDQQKEFDAFPGPILMTTNCIQKPRETYRGRIFTTGLVGWPDTQHIAPNANGPKDFSPIIAAAQAEAGFGEDAPEKTIMVGFARNAVLSVAPTVIEAVKSGAIKHFFLIGGCDGAKPGRNYYTELAEAVPDDCVILTLACGKYRFNKLEFGDIGGIPRLLDIGQCNDAYSAIQIAVALAGAFECDVNDLPLSMILSWYEQKAICILLTLLHLGIKNIKVGPSLPAFITPPVLNVLVDTFGLAPVTTPENDLKEILG